MGFKGAIVASRIFENSLIIHKKKTKESWLMSVFISNKDTAKVDVQFFRPE